MPPNEEVAMDEWVLKILVCPITQSALDLVSLEQLSDLNQQIVAGTLRNQAGQPVPQPLQAGLVNHDRSILYPIVDEIPNLIPDESIPLSPDMQLSGNEPSDE